MKRAVAFALLVAATPLAAQRPPIGVIDVYGARTLTADQIRAAARIAIGDSIGERTRMDVQARLTALPNVAAADVSIVCCENGRSIVYLGLRERGDSAIAFAAAPNGTARLPSNIHAAEREFIAALQQAVVSGNAEETDSLGHSLMKNPAARAAQQKFLAYAAGNVATLREVLRSSGDAEHRALAAQVIAYVPNKNSVVPDLVRALRDPDETVRNNATRALAMMAMYGQKHPEAALRVPYEPFIDMLNSSVWTDRNKASFVLMALSANKDVALLNALRRRAFDSLRDMVNWQSAGHAMPAAIILGRLGSMSDADIMKAFQTDRSMLIEAARSRR